MTGLPAAARFVFTWIIVGLAIAFLVVLLNPQWLTRLRSPADRPQNPAAMLSFADAVARTAPAVVNIFAARLVTEQIGPDRTGKARPVAPELRQGVETGLGSGVIVDKVGHVITNNHVIACAQEINVQLADGRTHSASVVGADPATDIAVLKIAMDNLPVAPLGSSDELRTGDIALAIGTPYGLSQTVTQGIVSAIGRGQLGVTAIESFIQTDAAINQGNSGGALINARGELIGINTAALAQSSGVNGISFAVPVNLVRGVMQEILLHGRVKRGWFGVETRGLSAEQAAALGLSTPEGLVVVRVYEDSPAARAGLQLYDVITRINGAQRSLTEALSLVAGTTPGKQISLSIVRGGKAYDLSAIVTERSPEMGVRNPCDQSSQPDLNH
jgi:serine protease DegS